MYAPLFLHTFVPWNSITYNKQTTTANEEIPYREMITEIFDELIMGDSLILCDISIKELRIMEKVYIEEKLYYDFLR